MHVFLIPGFFGFTNFGDVRYFAHVKEALERHLVVDGAPPPIVRVPTHPTASIEARAERLLQALLQHEAATGDDEGFIHLVGHSTGALDARCFLSPDFRARHPAAARIAPRVKSVVSVATPHYGTPVATFFASAFGKQLLQLLSLLTIHTMRVGPVPLELLLRFAALVTKIDHVLGVPRDTLDQFFDLLLADFSADRRAAIEAFFLEVAADQSLLAELTLESAAAFDERFPDAAGVRYGAVVARARRPSVFSMVETAIEKSLGPYAQASHAVFHVLHRLAARGSFLHVVDLHPAQIEKLCIATGEIPDARANDGMVPTLSQVRGEIICAVRADHLDVIGHFAAPHHDPPHFDWIDSGSGFGLDDFEALWRDVARFLLVADMSAAG